MDDVKPEIEDAKHLMGCLRFTAGTGAYFFVPEKVRDRFFDLFCDRVIGCSQREKRTWNAIFLLVRPGIYRAETIKPSSAKDAGRSRRVGK